MSNLEVLWVPVSLANGESDGQAYLMFVDQKLSAVLSRVNRDEEAGGSWFVETAFEARFINANPVFASLQEAEDWLKRPCWKPPQTLEREYA